MGLYASKLSDFKNLDKKVFTDKEHLKQMLRDWLLDIKSKTSTSSSSVSLDKDIIMEALGRAMVGPPAMIGGGDEDEDDEEDEEEEDNQETTSDLSTIAKNLVKFKTELEEYTTIFTEDGFEAEVHTELEEIRNYINKRSSSTDIKNMIIEAETKKTEPSSVPSSTSSSVPSSTSSSVPSAVSGIIPPEQLTKCIFDIDNLKKYAETLSSDDKTYINEQIVSRNFDNIIAKLKTFTNVPITICHSRSPFPKSVAPASNNFNWVLAKKGINWSVLNTAIANKTIRHKKINELKTIVALPRTDAKKIDRLKQLMKTMAEEDPKFNPNLYLIGGSRHTRSNRYIPPERRSYRQKYTSRGITRRKNHRPRKGEWIP